MIEKNPKLKLPLPSFNKFFLIFILSLYVATAHILLPAFNKQVFFFLFRWDVFSFMPKEFVYDFTFDEGKTFLIRDHNKKLKSVNRFTLQSLLDKQKIERIRTNYKSSFLKLCQCESIYLIKLKGSLADHFIYKKPLKIVGTTKL
ncbi:MAG: hypothetical protein OXJ52_04415 [Oligoflexia bacterium]|nr:hypothetical protein [Oligoflexia bacterium]